MKKLFTVLFLSSLLFSCQKDEEALKTEIAVNGGEVTDKEDAEIEVQSFIYEGMNDIYLYKEDVAELGDEYFSSEPEKTDFLLSFATPESLFEKLTAPQDRFSFMTDDYKALEESFKGISSSTAGMNYGLGRISGTNNIFAFLQYVVPGTSADDAGLQRGTVFTEVDGVKLTIDNFSELLNRDSFTINTGVIQDGALVMSDEKVTLEHMQYTENPIHLAKTFELEGKKIGYLMYNSFVSDFDDELNDAFGDFQSEGVSELILDLRYNGGGSVETAVDLSSMITGQFEGEIFMKEQWNPDYQEYFEQQNPEILLNRFDPSIRTREAINSLRLSRIYVLTSSRTASASELVINGLEPYIDVIQVGEPTTGKFQASVTLYDSPDFSKEGINENHTYAIQPLVFKSANAAGKSDYVNGLSPDISYQENLSNLGTLGDPEEPLLRLALDQILGRSSGFKMATRTMTENRFEVVGQVGMFEPGYQKMYIEEVPPRLQ